MKYLSIISICHSDIYNQLDSLFEQLPYRIDRQTCSDINAALALFDSQSFDLCFLELQAVSQASAQPLLLQNHTPVIGLIAQKETALDWLEVGIADFLLLPLQYHYLSRSVARTLHINTSYRGITLPDRLIVKVGRKAEIIAFDQIVFVEAYGALSKIHKVNGTTVIVSEMLGWFESQLPRAHFIRIHKSYIVNADLITGFDRRSVYLDSKSFEIGVAYKAKLGGTLNFLDKET